MCKFQSLQKCCVVIIESDFKSVCTHVKVRSQSVGRRQELSTTSEWMTASQNNRYTCTTVRSVDRPFSGVKTHAVES